MAQDFTAKFRVDISDLKKNISEANKQIKLANATFKAETSGMDSWEKNADGLSSKLKQLRTVLEQQKTILSSYEQQLQRQQKSYQDNGERVGQLKAKLRELAANGVDKASDEYQKYERELRNAIKEQDNSAKAADDLKIKILNQKAAVGKTEAAVERYTRAEEELGDESKEAAKDVEKLDKSFEDVSDGADDAAHGGLSSFGVALGNLTSRVIEAAIRKLKDLAAEALNAGMNFESAMSQVEAISGATGSDLDALTKKAQEMGAKTKFSATESAEAFSYMAMAGWDTEDMLNGIEGVMALSAASGEDLARTSDIVTDALTAMGYSAGDAGHLADVMAAASANANTNVGLMGSTFQYAAPLVGALGYSMEDTATAIGLMANAGIKGDKAGTALRAMLTRLASPTAEVQGKMENLGISLTDNEGKMKPLRKVIRELRDGFSELSEKEKAGAASAIAGKNAMSGLLAIVNSSESDFNKLISAVDNANGAAEKMSGTMMNNVAGGFTMLKSAIEGVEIQIFNKFKPALNEGISSITDFVNSIGWNKSGEAIITQIADGIISALPGIAAAAQKIVEKAANVLIKIAPKVLDVGIEIALNLLHGLTQTAPKLLNNITTDLVPKLANRLIKGAPKIMEAGLKLFGDLVKSLPETAKKFFSADGIPKLIENIGKAIQRGGADVMKAGVELFKNLVKAIPKVAIEVVKGIPKLVASIVAALSDSADGLMRGFFEGLLGGVESAATRGNRVLDELDEKHQKIMEQLEADREEIEQNAKAWEELKDAQSAEVAQGLGELSYYQSLATELQTLYDKNGHVIKGYEARVDFIKSELHNGLGIELLDLDAEKLGNDKVAESIQGVIEKKRAEIILSSKEKLYNEALEKRTSTMDKLQKAQEDYSETLSEGVDAGNKAAKLYNEWNEAYNRNEMERYRSLKAEWEKYNKIAEDSTDHLDELAENISGYQKELDGYNYSILDYEKSFELAQKGEYDSIKYYSKETVQAFQKTGDVQKAELEKRIADLTNYKESNLRLWKETGDEQFKIEADKNQKELDELNEALDSYNSTTQRKLSLLDRIWLNACASQIATIKGRNVEFKDAGYGTVQMYENGVKVGEPLPIGEMKSVAGQMVKAVKDKDDDAFDAAVNFVKGLEKGINEQKQYLMNTITSVGNEMGSALRNALDVRSPSRVTEKIGKFFVEGLNVGIQRATGSALTQVALFGRKIAEKAQTVLDLGALGLGDISANLTAPMNGIASSLQNSVVNNQKTINFTQNNYSPEPLSRIEVYRQTHNLMELYREVI